MGESSVNITVQHAAAVLKAAQNAANEEVEDFWKVHQQEAWFNQIQ